MRAFAATLKKTLRRGLRMTVYDETRCFASAHHRIDSLAMYRKSEPVLYGPKVCGEFLFKRS